MTRLSFSRAACGPWYFILATTVLLSACATGPTDVTPKPPPQIPHQWSNADWATVLSAVTTPDGYVIWSEIQKNTNGVRASLMNYVGLLQAISPVNHPGYFPNPDDKRAYWINAFNATCMYAVVAHGYPDTIVTGNPPQAIYAMDEFTFGGAKMTLDDLLANELKPENDARVLFAINFCAKSSPPLRASPYDGAVLDAQLLDQGQRYLSDPRAAVRDGDAAKINDLFFQYRTDFLSSFQKLMGKPATGILDALQPYVQNDSAIVGATKTEKLGFDWSLNRPPR